MKQQVLGCLLVGWASLDSSIDNSWSRSQRQQMRIWRFLIDDDRIWFFSYILSIRFSLLCPSVYVVYIRPRLDHVVSSN